MQKDGCEKNTECEIEWYRGCAVQVCGSKLRKCTTVAAKLIAISIRLSIVLQYSSRWPRTDPRCVSSTPVNRHLSPTVMTPLLQSNAQQSVACSHSTNYKLWRNHEIWSYRSGEYYVYVFLQCDSLYFGRLSPTPLQDAFYTHIRTKIFDSIDNVLDYPSFESGQGDWLLWPSIFVVFLSSTNIIPK